MKIGLEARGRRTVIGRHFSDPMETIKSHLTRASIIFLCAFALRRFLFCGFILGDDAQDFSTIKNAFLFRPDLTDQYHLRFGGWAFNYAFFQLFGISETTFFLPTWMLSSGLAVSAYAFLIRWGYGPSQAFWGALVVASAPFEVLIGTVRANDLFLAVAVVTGLLALVFLDRRPALQGSVLAFCFWFGLYVKVWAVYFLPGLFVYFAVGVLRKRAWRGPASFFIVSLLLHGVTSLYWKNTIGIFFPFIAYHPPTYPVPAQDLAPLFGLYPSMLFRGSEFGTTLFGVIPYLWLLLLSAKTIGMLFPSMRVSGLKLDRIDAGLLLLYGSFFLFLNFFPNSFMFDRYYSIQRIFRYMTPLSFPMTLHVAKMLCDVVKLVRLPAWNGAFAAHAVFAMFIALNLLQAYAATQPGRDYRHAFQGVLSDVRAERPVTLLAESWMGFFLRSLYLRDMEEQIPIIPTTVNKAKEYEAWLEGHQAALPVGSMLVTGLGGYVHYGTHFDGFKLNQFSRPLHANWTLVREYGPLGHLPVPESARLWRLSAPIPASATGSLPLIRTSAR